MRRRDLPGGDIYLPEKDASAVVNFPSPEAAVLKWPFHYILPQAAEDLKSKNLLIGEVL